MNKTDIIIEEINPVANSNTYVLQKEFLKNIVTPDKEGIIEIRTISNKSISKFFNNTENAVKYADSLNGKTNVYYGIAARKDGTSGKKENCHRLHTLFLDVDCGSNGHKKISMFQSKENALEHINRLGIKPSVIVDSGNGLHLYFLLKESLDLTHDNISKAESLMKRLGLLYASDSTQNIDRIFRLPFTKNIKGEVTKECVILEADFSRKYDFAEIENHPFIKLNLEKIFKKGKDKKLYYNALFGASDLGTDDRSARDQSLISFLCTNGFSDEEIHLLFKYFPTSGKYFGHNSPESYLTHSINNARGYIDKDKYCSNNPVRAGFSDRTNNSTSNTRATNELTYLADNELEKNRQIESDNLEQLQKYAQINKGEKIGYYAFLEVGKVYKDVRLTNFIIQLESRVITEFKNKYQTFYRGKIILENREFNFRNLSGAELIDIKSLKNFIINLCGLDAIIFSQKELIIAISKLNPEVPEFVEQEFGYNKNLDKYVTKNLVITKDEIIEKETAIKNSEYWDENTLEFKLVSEKESKVIKEQIVEHLLTWETAKAGLSSISYTLGAVIQPYINKILGKKAYIMLIGVSGAGKTQLANWLQSFYGNFNNLLTWGSTDTSLNIIGESFKDVVLVADDLKIENFRSEKDYHKALLLVQNYADNTARQRGTINLQIQNAKKFKGSLIITAESNVFQEASTTARGIIIKLENKETNFNKVSLLNKLSKELSGIMPYYIQYILNNYSQNKIAELYTESRRYVMSITKNLIEKCDRNNFDREVNNLAYIHLCWKIASVFLIESSKKLNYWDSQFEVGFKELVEDNFKEINLLNPVDVFVDTLWELAEIKEINFKQMNEEYPSYSKNICGTYLIDKDANSVKLAVNLKSALNVIRRYGYKLSIDPNTLKQRLETEGLIESGCGKVRIGSSSIRGVKWIGAIPKPLFGLEDKITPVEQAEKIIEKASNDNNNFFELEKDANRQYTFGKSKIEEIPKKCPISLNSWNDVPV